MQATSQLTRILIASFYVPPLLALVYLSLALTLRFAFAANEVRSIEPQQWEVSPYIEILSLLRSQWFVLLSLFFLYSNQL